jgi:hypothetical protein
MNPSILVAIRCSLMFLVPSVTYAIGAQWDLDPISGDWNTAANWTPNEVPNGPSDIATFGLSKTTDVSISANTEVNGITFSSAATNPYTITSSAGLTLTISGVGIRNNSGITQHVNTAVDASNNGGTIAFSNSATAGSNVSIFNDGGTINFLNTSTAGSATINLNPSGDTFPTTSFFNRSTAGDSTIFVGETSGAGLYCSPTTRLQAARSSTLIAALLYNSPTIPVRPIRSSKPSITPKCNSWTTPLQAARIAVCWRPHVERSRAASPS